MNPLYAYSLLPVIAVALLLFFTAALRGQTELDTAAWAALALGGAYVGLALGLGAFGLWQP